MKEKFLDCQNNSLRLFSWSQSERRSKTCPESLRLARRLNFVALVKTWSRIRLDNFVKVYNCPNWIAHCQCLRIHSHDARALHSRLIVYILSCGFLFLMFEVVSFLCFHPRCITKLQGICQMMERFGNVCWSFPSPSRACAKDYGQGGWLCDLGTQKGPWFSRTALYHSASTIHLVRCKQ